VQLLHTHESKQGKDTCWNYFWNGEVMKENGGSGEFKYDMFDII
jgi:hypothetical protein